MMRGTAADSPLRRALDTVADTLLLAIWVTLASLPLVTAFGALHAAARVLADDADNRTVSHRFRQALRERWRTKLGAQLIIGLSLVIGLGDLLLAPTIPAPIRPAVATLGILVLIAVVTVPPYAAAVSVADPARPVRRLLTYAAALALGRPLPTLAVLGLAVVCAAWSWATPILAPLLFGTYTVAAAHVATRTLRAVISSSPAHVKPVPS